MKQRHLILATCCIIAALRSAAAAAAEPVTVNVGIVNAISDGLIFIAEKKGYFAAEGITVNTMAFPSAANMVAPLSAGQLEVGAGAPSAGLYNAVIRGIALKIVADKASSQPGYTVNKMLVRKDLVDSGRYKTLADLKGMTVALNGAGNTNVATLAYTLQKAGLKYSDVKTVDLPFPDHVVALKNKAVDAAFTVEPLATIAVREGVGVVESDDATVDPGHQIAVLLFSPKFAAQRDLAVRFTKAYLRSVRYYHGGLKDGKLAGPNADDVISILTHSTRIKDPAVFRAITPNGVDPDGRVNRKSLQQDLDLWRSQGLINGPISLDRVVDTSFVETALKELGPDRP
ncbi:MAG TPA: ABC transporter substrate-binding protein [Stellaceae bacterium]|nr:ABC transporter substrate-binding protein [Stellaceae bacterium]